MTRRAFWIVLILGTALRLLLIGQAELWYDENFTLILARMPFAQMLQATMGDVHPPLYYVLIWPLAQIPMLPPWALRIPSALFSIASLALYPRLMYGLSVPGRVQLVSFAFMAMMPMQLHYAQEARMYALLELLVILAAIAVLESRPVLLALATAGLLYTQNYGTFYVAVLAAAVLIVIWQQHDRHARLMADLHLALSNYGLRMMTVVDPLDADMRADLRRKWRRQGIAVLIGVLAWLPWLPTMLQQASMIQGNYWIFDTSPGGMLYEIYKLFWAISLATPATNVVGLLLTFGLLILGAWYLLHRRPQSWPVIATLAFGPIVLAIIVSLVFQPLLLFRPLIGVTPFLYLVCAYPIGNLASVRGRLYAACFIVPVMMLGVSGYYINNPEQKTGQGTGSMRQAIEYITDRWQPGDVILHGSALGWISMTPYTDLPQYAIPNCTPKFPGSISAATRDMIGVPAGDIDELPPHRRIWFTAVFSPMLPECQAAHTEQIIGDREPVLVLSETKFLLSAIWLLEE